MLSKERIVAAFGIGSYEWLREKIVPTIQTHLLVKEKSLKSKHPAGKPCKQCTSLNPPVDQWA